MKKQIFWRLYAIVLATVMLFTAVPVLAAEETVVYYHESFENWATNQTPTDTTYSGFNVHVVETGELNKALYLEPDNNEVKVTVPLPNVTETFFITMNLSVDGQISTGRINLTSSSNATTKIIDITNNTLSTYDGQKGLPSLKKSKTSLTICYKPEEKRLTVYNDDTVVLSNWFVANGPSTVAAVDFAMETESYDAAKVYIDSVYAYSSPGDVKQSIPKVPYTDIVSEWEAEEYDTTPKIYVFKNFDTASAGLGGFAMQTGTEGAALVEKDGESYYEIPVSDQQYVCDVAFAGAKSKVMFELLVKQGATGAQLNISYVDKPNAFDQFLAISPGGQVTAGNSVLGSLKSGQWNHIAIAIHCGSQTLDGYLNGELKVKGVSRRAATQSPIKIRIHRPAAAEKGSIMLDNLRIYSGDVISELDDAPYTGISILGSDTSAQRMLAGRNGFHAYSSQIAVNGERKLTETAPYFVDDVLYGSANDLSEMVGEISATNGSKDITVGEETLTLDYAAAEKDGVLYLPVKNVAEKLGKFVFEHERGLLLFGDESIKLNDAKATELNNYMQFGRLTPEQVTDIMKDKSHPRVSINKEYVDHMRATYQADDAYQALVAKTMTDLCYPTRTLNADSSMNNHWYYDYAMLSAWLATGDPYLVDKVRESIMLACAKDTWITDDSLTPATYMAAMAICYDWLYDEWTPEERKMLEDSIIEKGLKHFEKVLKGTDPSVTNSTAQGNNINAVCMSGVLMGAFAVWDRDPELCSYMIAEGMRALEKVMVNFFPDGAWAEGLDYSAYMMNFQSHAISSITKTLGHDYGFLTVPNFKNYFYFYVAGHGNNGANNYHDASEWELMQYADGYVIPWAAHMYNDPELYQLRKKYLELSGLTAYLDDVVYYNSEWNKLEGLELTLDHYYAEAELVALRSDYEKDGVYLGAHFGPELVSHSHYDTGTFILDMLGERWAVDLGKDDYGLPGYFITGTRDTYYRCRPEGHNLFIINPDETIGHNYYGYGDVTKFESAENEAFAIGDLSSIYTNSLSSKRGIMLTDNRESAIIRDEIRTKDASEVYWLMQTPAEISIVDGDTAILSLNGKQVQLDFVTNASGAELLSMKAEPLPTSPNPAGQNPNTGVNKVAIRIPSASNIDLTVRITPVGGAAASKPVPNTPLDQWTVQEN